jgi:cytochrome c-type biogenesis protein CcmH
MRKFLFFLMLLAAPALCSTGLAQAPPAAGAAPAAQAAPAAGVVPETFSDPAMEARARNLQRQLRCLVCQGESIDESGASLAAELRQLVRQQMVEGRSDRQIEDYLKARYGNFILMKPPLEADTYFLWAAPFVVLIGAAGVAMFVIGKARRAAAEHPPELL